MASIRGGIDLRFAKPEEAAFQKHMEASLVQYTCCIAGFLTLVTGAFLARDLAVEVKREGDPLKWSELEPRTLRIAAALAQTILFAVMFCLSMVRANFGYLLKVDWELTIIVAIVLVMQYPILGRASMVPLWCNLSAHDCSSVDMTDSVYLSHEIRCLGFIDGSITAMNLFLPIRSCRGWCVGVILVGEYALCTLLAAHGGSYIVPVGEAVNILVTLAVLVLFAYVGGRIVEKHHRANWLAQSKLLNHLDQQQLAMSRILGRLCDSLVHLGSDFQIMQLCPKLDALLFRHRTVGRDFSDFIASDSSKQLFIDQLRGSMVGSERPTDTDGDMTGMMNLSLWDSNGQVVKVYAHHARFHASDGTTQYLLGLVETGERPVPIPECQGGPQNLHSVPLPELSGELGMTVESNEEGEFVITAMRPSMTSLFSEVSEGDLAETICDEKDRRRFIAWLQHSCNAAAGRDTPFYSKYGCASFAARPRHGDNVLYLAKLSGTFESTEEGDKVILSFAAPSEAGSRSSRSMSRSSRSMSRSSRSMSRSSRSSRSSLGLVGMSDAGSATLSARSSRPGASLLGTPLACRSLPL